MKTLKAMYKNVSGKVRVGSKMTNEISCYAGVRQGCKLSPLLFSLLINEVGKSVSTLARGGYQFMPGTQITKSLMFADDISMMANTPGSLQHAINILNVTAKQYGLKININKTKIIVFRKGGYLNRHEKWFIEGEKVEVVNQYKYLGYTLTTKLSGDVALAEYVGRARAKVYSILKALKTLGKVNISIFFKLFDSQVLPTLLYAGEVWGLTPFDRAEAVHTFACKKLLGVRKQTPNFLVYGELGRFPIWIESKIRAVKYWLKIMKMEDTRIPKLAFYRECNENKPTHNWSKDVKSLLEQTGFAYVWETGNLINERAFINEFRQRLRDNFIQSWSAKCNSDRFQVYKSVKSVFETEKYLNSITIAKFRTALARLRIAASYLHVNRRLIHPNASIKCAFCPKEDETELHFLLECKIYDTLRDKYVYKHFKKGAYISLPNLLANTSVGIMHDVAMFTYYAHKTRSERLREMQLRKNILVSIQNKGANGNN